MTLASFANQHFPHLVGELMSSGEGYEQENQDQSIRKLFDDC